MQRSGDLRAIGIIAEFNPLHKGHKYLIEEAKKQGETVICVLSSNFVQRGDTAIVEKRIRTLSALKNGTDIVIELPVLWSMSTAQNFALGAVSALKEAGCEKIIFGSEEGDIKSLSECAEILSSDQFSALLSEELKKGVTFAAARQKAAEKLGAKKDILSGANNNLGLEYIIAAKSLNYKVQFETVKRIGASHDSLEEAEFVSASFVREKLKLGDFEKAKEYMPEIVFNPENISDIKRIETAILGILRTKTLEELSLLPDLSEGLQNKLFSAIRKATSLNDLYEKIKVKRYTLARIRRLVLSAFIGADNEFFMKPLPYLRVLGFSKNGSRYLKKLKSSSVPVITRTADINDLSATAKKVFETEAKASDLFGLTLKTPLECGTEYTAKIIKTE